MHLNAQDKDTYKKALNILSTYDVISGGKLEAVAKKSRIDRPSDLNAYILSQCLSGLEVECVVAEWALPDWVDNDGNTREGRKGNWIRSFSKPKKESKATKKSKEEDEDEFDDDIPF